MLITATEDKQTILRIMHIRPIFPFLSKTSKLSKSILRSHTEETFVLCHVNIFKYEFSHVKLPCLSAIPEQFCVPK